jgi:tetrahydromethanopterin S-methyltransferase subunit E
MCIIYLRTLKCIFVLISYLVKSCVFGIIIIIIIICWHNSHQNDYRNSTGNIKRIHSDELQMKTHKHYNSKSHLEYLLK